MIKCIRIEHEDGFGPFYRQPFRIYINPWNTLKNTYRKHESFNAPIEDPLIWTSGSECIGHKRLNRFKDEKVWWCAYHSEKQILSMYTEREIKHLMRNKYNVFLLEVKEYQVGEDNIIFTKESVINRSNITNKILNGYKTKDTKLLKEQKKSKKRIYRVKT